MNLLTVTDNTSPEMTREERIKAMATRDYTKVTNGTIKNIPKTQEMSLSTIISQMKAMSDEELSILEMLTGLKYNREEGWWEFGNTPPCAYMYFYHRGCVIFRTGNR